MSAFQTVLFEKQGHIAMVTLNRPEALNTFSVRMRDDLYQILTAIDKDDDIRVAVISGAGEKAFCAGADLSEFLTAPPPVEARRVKAARDIWYLFTMLEKPLIAALHGYVLGSGMELAMYCDIRIAAEKTRFGLPEMGLGIIPAAGGTQTLPRLIGSSPALEMLLTNRWIESDEAARLKLVNRIVPGPELIRATLKIATRIASYDSKAIRNIKYAVRTGMDLTLDEGLKLENRLSRQLFFKKNEI